MQAVFLRAAAGWRAGVILGVQVADVPSRAVAIFALNGKRFRTLRRRFILPGFSRSTRQGISDFHAGAFAFGGKLHDFVDRWLIMFVHHFTAGRHAVERPGIVANTGVQLIGADIHKWIFLLLSFAEPIIQGFLKISFFRDTFSHVLSPYYLTQTSYY